MTRPLGFFASRSVPPARSSRFVSPSSPPQQKAPFLRRHGGKLVASALIGIGLVAMLQKSGLRSSPRG